MRRYLFFITTLFLAQVSLAEQTAFINVNVVPMSSDAIIEQQTVIVDRGVIEAIGPVDDVPIPKGATVVDGTDRYLMPGLAEMHAHVPDAGSKELDRYFSLYVANGVTTIRGMLGQPSHLGLRQDLLDGDVFGPRLVTSGPSLNGRSVRNASHARHLVEEQHAAGYDFIKVHPGLSSVEFEALAKTANALDMPFAGTWQRLIILTGILLRCFRHPVMDRAVTAASLTCCWQMNSILTVLSHGGSRHMERADRNTDRTVHQRHTRYGPSQSSRDALHARRNCAALGRFQGGGTRRKWV
jgi:hypothetical protein